MAYLGQIAALATALCWVFTALCFTVPARGWARNGELLTALLALVLTAIHWIAFGQPLPLDADATRWLYLGLWGSSGSSLATRCCSRRSSASGWPRAS